QSAGVQQVAGLSFGIGQQALVHLLVDGAAMTLTPALHGTEIDAPIVGKIVQVVTVLVPAPENLAEARPAGFKRIAAAIDDMRTWQHRPYRTHQDPVA